MEKHGCFVHEGRELSESEFNACSQTVMAKNQDLRCFAKVVASDGESGPDPKIAELEKKLADKQARLETVQASLIAARTGAPTPETESKVSAMAGRIAELEAEISAASFAAEPTLEQAIAIVEAQAPDRLKKKPGRKAEVREPVEV